MKKINSDAERQVVVNRYIQGENITSISSNTGISRGTIYSWIKRAQEDKYNHRDKHKNSQNSSLNTWGSNKKYFLF